MTKIKKKNLALFLLVCLSTAVTLLIGGGVGLVLGGINGPLGAALGGVVGSVIGVEIGYHRRLVEAGWGRILWLIPTIGFIIPWGLAAANGLPSILIASSGVIGSGLGALIAKYMVRFFDYEPPPRIFK